jgi:hypothetical protein
MRPNGGWSSSGTQNMQASMGQYSMHAGEPAQPVQQSVVIARILGRFLRVAFPSPSDIGQCLSTISNIHFKPQVSSYITGFDSNIALRISSTICVGEPSYLLRGPRRVKSSGDFEV